MIVNPDDVVKKFKQYLDDYPGDSISKVEAIDELYEALNAIDHEGGLKVLDE